MIRILTTLAAATFAIAVTSCCCTSESKPPTLRPLPQFQEIPQAEAPQYSPAPIRATK